MNTPSVSPPVDDPAPESEGDTPPAKPQPPAPGRPRGSRTRLVARNVSTTMISQVISWALTFLVTIYVPRYLRDTGFGLLTLVQTFAGAVLMFVDIGMGTFLTKEIARDRGRVGQLVSSALALRIPLAVIWSAVGLGIAILLRYDRLTIELIAIGLGVAFLGQVGAVLGIALYGLERIVKQNIAGIINNLLTSILMIALVLHRAPIWQFVAIGAVTTILSLGLNSYYFRDYWHTLTRPRIATMREIVIGGVPFITATIFNAVYIKIDILLMSKMASFAAIGWYSLGMRLGGTCMTIPVALCGAMMPTATRIYHEDPGAFSSAIRRTINLMLITVVPFSAVLILAPDKIINLLHYPPEFRNAIPVMQIWGFSLVLYYLSQVAAMALIASDRQWTLSRVTAVAAAFSIPLTAICIYIGQHYIGNAAAGASASDVIAEIYITSAYLRALPAGIFSVNSLGVLARALVAALPLIAVLHFFVHNRYDLIWAVPPALCYLPLCWLMRCLHPQDISMLRQALKRG